MRCFHHFNALLALAAALPNVALAQSAAPAASTEGVGDEDEIVVTGQRPRGAVLTDIKPELQLNAGDVRALGVSSVTELLAELGPQLESARGGQPVVLLEGRRVSSFREVASLPSEAIARVDILPEEVALRYGYRADQKVVNIVLRQRFRAFTLEARDRIATRGGANRAQGAFDFLTIRKGGRLNITADYVDTGQLLESQRGIALAGGGGDTLRTLTPDQRTLTLGATYARPLGDQLNASINGEVTTDQSRALLGSSVGRVTLAGSSPFATTPEDVAFTPLVPGAGPLRRLANSRTAHLGTTVNLDTNAWQGTLTATYDHGEGRTLTDRSLDLTAYQAALAAGDPAADPALPLAPAYRISRPADVAESRSDVATVDLTASGTVFAVPAGDISLTARAGGTLNRFASDSLRNDIARSARLERSLALGSLSLDVPLIDSPSPFIGRLSANGNVEAQSLSDAGTLRTFGFGLSWNPRRTVSLIASFRQSESAATVQQLGNPQTVSPAVPIYDFATGQTVLARQVTGGNPGLRTADERDWRIGLTVKPLRDPDLTVTLSYNNRRTSDAIAALPAATAATERAFPDRFLRDADGNLIELDTRPVNIASQESGVLRYGFNITKTLKTPQAQIDAIRAAFQRRFPNGFPGGGPGGFGGGSEGGRGGDFARAHAGPGGGGPGSGGGGFGGGGFGGRGGRVNLAVYHSVHLVERATLRAGLAPIDLLDGGTLGNRAGQPRHEVELQAGVAQSGLGLRLTGNWQSATRIAGVPGVSPDLRFSGLTTVNLRLFANLTAQPGLVSRFPWLRGTRVTLGIGNLFDSRQRVTDGTGATPFAYQAGFLDPLGRSVTVSLRKLFF